MNKNKGENKLNYLIMTMVGIYLALPLVTLFLYSLSVEWSSILPEGLTFRYYQEIFQNTAFLTSILRSILISVIPVVVTTILILLVMYVVILYHPRMDKYLQILCTIPYAIQGVILAIGVLSLYADSPRPLSNRTLMLSATYCIVILPYLYQGIRNSLFSVNAPRLVEAARILGASRLYAYFGIIVPNILSGITVSALLGSAIVFGDFVVIKIIGANYFETSQMYLYRALSQSGQKTSAIVVILFTVTLILSASVLFIGKKGTILEEKEQ